MSGIDITLPNISFGASSRSTEFPKLLDIF